MTSAPLSGGVGAERTKRGASSDRCGEAGNPSNTRLPANSVVLFGRPDGSGAVGVPISLAYEFGGAGVSSGMFRRAVSIWVSTASEGSEGVRSYPNRESGLGASVVPHRIPTRPQKPAPKSDN